MTRNSPVKTSARDRQSFGASHIFRSGVLAIVLAIDVGRIFDPEKLEVYDLTPDWLCRSAQRPDLGILSILS